MNANDNTKQLDPKNIKFVKLISGESLLLYARHVNENFISCELPVRIITVPVPDQEFVSYGLTAFAEMANNSQPLNINLDHVTTITDARPDAVDMYLKYSVAHYENDKKKRIQEMAKQRQKVKPKLVYQNDEHPIFQDTDHKAFLESVPDEEDEIH